ncbi:MAG: tetrathionate reductase family octaheme c-type cytochrome [Anaerolineaceae bacterium]|nr:tetrathionate reductase family octaheme c-type cytochrome [Anaerolineaceae bacterium]
MKDFKYIWIVGIVVTALIIAIPIFLFVADPLQAGDAPWSNVPEHPTHTDHTNLMTGPYETGQEVTAACLECHETAAHEVAQTAHYTWLSDPVTVAGQDEPIRTGKANLINNFCIGVQSNWPGCTRCHAGYGWSDETFDFTNEANVDCLVCHDQSGGYVKSTAGNPADGVDLVAAAQSVGTPTRENCGGCHFNGGGGNGVKHGDMDESLYFPDENIDFHMGGLNFQCVDCHRTTDHNITGRAMSVSIENSNQVACTDCHSTDLHEDDRITAHLDALACQTCHIPYGAVREPTKVQWDWSTAGRDDIEEDPHIYLKIKGSFVYESNILPTYAWFNGNVDRYFLGDPIDPNLITVLNAPEGDIDDPNALIWPFKIHEALQPYDTVYNYLLQPKTVGEGGFWTDFDWDQALRLGSDTVGMAYSGQYGFATTDMYWNLSHMVAPKENALQCTECHGEDGRMDWQALGYYGDPIDWGGRNTPSVQTANANSGANQ